MKRPTPPGSWLQMFLTLRLLSALSLFVSLSITGPTNLFFISCALPPLSLGIQILVHAATSPDEEFCPCISAPPTEGASTLTSMMLIGTNFTMVKKNNFSLEHWHPRSLLLVGDSCCNRRINALL
jgi:hypothetical protein